jgi:stage V sporulation protein B
LALSGAKLYFLALGLAQQIAMSWLLVDGYGALRGALSPASITYNPLITAGVQGMSRAVSRVHEDERAAAIRLGLVVHWVLAVIVAAVFFFAAPLMGELLNSDYLVPSFRILGLVVLFYGCYAPLVGVLNGMRRFGAQAGLDVLSATLRTAALFGGAWVLLPQGTTRAVEGASWGFVSVAAVMLIVSIFLVGVGKPGKSRLHVREHLGFIVPVILAQVILNLLLQADTNTLRAFATRAAEGAGLEPQAADVLVGAYNAGQLFGFLPYQVLIGLTFILFPLLASAHGRGEVDAVRRFVLEGNRIAAIVMGLVVSVSAGLSESLLRLIFPPNFAELGTGSMQILTIGLGAFALFGVFTTVLNSLGKQWHALGLTAVALLGVALLNWWWVRDAAYGSELLVKTAMATSVGMVGAAIVAGVLVKRSAGSVLSPWVALRVGVAVAVLVIAGRNLPALGRPLTVAASAAFGLAYVLMLALMRELGGRDWQRVRAIFGR